MQAEPAQEAAATGLGIGIMSVFVPKTDVGCMAWNLGKPSPTSHPALIQVNITYPLPLTIFGRA